MRCKKQTWAIGIVLASSLLMPITGCTWKEDIWRENSTSKTPSSISDADIEPDAAQDAAGQVANEEEVISSQEFPSVQERIAFAFISTRPSSYRLDRVLDGNVLEWPDTKYIGEAVFIKETSVTLKDIRIVAGGNVLEFYNPELDDTIDAPTGIPQWLNGQAIPAVMIPSGSSLVMIHMEVAYDGVCARGTGSKTLWFGSLRLSYPEYGATKILILDPSYYLLDDYKSVTDYCTDTGWAYFLIPGIDLDPSMLRLEYISGTDKENLVFWALTERP